MTSAHASPRRRLGIAVSCIGACTILSSGCRSAAPESAPVLSPTLSSAAAVQCTAIVRKLDVSSWREVQMPTFLVCLPGEWKLSGTTWRRGPSTIRWGTGIYPDPEGRPSATGSGLSGAAIDRQEGGTAGNVVRRFGEMIGGSWADLWRSRRGGIYRTGVQWTDARVWFAGQSPDAQTADLQLDIYRTVRFVGR